MNSEVLDVSIKDLKIDEDQPRKVFDDAALTTLTESIKEKGVEVPLLIQKSGAKSFIIVDGERRYRASKNAGLDYLPCVIVGEDMDKVQLFQKQLRLDFLKEKLSSEELDDALYKLWEMLGSLPEEEAASFDTGTKGDWRIMYMVKHTGISYTRIKIALEKKDFKERNKKFDKKVKEDIEKCGKAIKEKRYNRIIEETARFDGLRNDDETRKKVISKYLNDEVTSDQKDLRDRLRILSKRENPNDAEINAILGTGSVQNCDEAVDFIISQLDVCLESLQLIKQNIRKIETSKIREIKKIVGDILKELAKK